MSVIGLIIGTSLLIAAASGKKSASKAATIAQKYHVKYSGMKETDAGMYDFLMMLWKSIGLTEKAAKQYIKERQPWSAAFVSACMLQAGHKDFPASASHSCYNEAARKNREKNTGMFQLYRINEYKPKVGDIVSKGRAGVKITYDTVKCGQLSHSDIVVKVTPTELITIGGNVGDTVSITKVPLKNGFIDKPGYYAIIKNLH